MKPTQQEIIELAREQGLYLDGINTQSPLYVLKQEELVSLVHLALERFGAGGGEPVAWLHKGGHVQVRAHYLSTEAIKSYSTNGQWQPLYLHPSPTDLRAEYLRGLEEGFKEGWIECSKWAQRDDLIADIGSPSYEACVSAAKALKGKQ